LRLFLPPLLLRTLFYLPISSRMQMMSAYNIMCLAISSWKR
jgi:hypothetical protein